MPFGGGSNIIINIGGAAPGPGTDGGESGWLADKDKDAIPDVANTLSEGGVVVTPLEVKQAEQDIIDLGNDKLSKTDVISGGEF